jgi:TonB family protein
MNYFLLLMLCYFGVGTLAQNTTQPKFKGGDRAFYQLSTEYINPTPAFIKSNATGTTFVSFRVNVHGEVDSVRIVKSFGFGMDEEAVRFLKLTSGKWIPAQKAGKQVSAFINMPFRWHIQD